MTAQKTCFVVQGFGEKTDLTTGRKLNLDASYQVIKDAVEEAGLRCVRADEVVKSGTIDRPMYEWIVSADLVIADLSTYNVNAAYELGVRYGVAPRATITVAEDQFKNPFDVSHIVVHNYRHLGEDIGAAEARRFKKDLAEIIRGVLAEQKTDSPIYEFLDLEPPVRRQATGERAAQAVAPPSGGPVASADFLSSPDPSAKALLDLARQAMSDSNFVVAQALLSQIHKIRPADEYVVQQLVLATYKGKQPDALTALQQARQIMLDHLDPDTTNNPETLGLWGAIHKRLWDATEQREHLDKAIAAYERGFYLKQDYYSGINLAFLFNIRASVLGATAPAEAIADFVLARRVRREVTRLCEEALPRAQTPADQYWITATLWEAAVGLEDAVAATRWQSEAERLSSAKWMLDSTRSQLETLQKLLTAASVRTLPLQP